MGNPRMQPSLASGTVNTDNDIYPAGKSYNDDILNIVPGKKRHPEPINRSIQNIVSWIDNIGVDVSDDTDGTDWQINAAYVKGDLSLTSLEFENDDDEITVSLDATGVTIDSEYDSAMLTLGSVRFWQDTDGGIHYDTSDPEASGDGSRLTQKAHVIASATSGTLTNNTLTKIVYTESTDTGGNFASGTFTAPRDGIYRVSAMVTLGENDQFSDTEYLYIIIRKNGSDAIAGDYWYGSGAAQYPKSSVTGNLALEKDDTIDIYGYQKRGANADLLDSALHNYLFIDEL